MNKEEVNHKEGYIYIVVGQEIIIKLKHQNKALFISLIILHMHFNKDW